MTRKLENNGSEYWIEREKGEGEDIFKIGKLGTSEAVLILQGDIAKKIYYLMLMESRIPTEYSEVIVEENMMVNCHGTVNWLIDKTGEKRPRKNGESDFPTFTTERMTMERAIQEYGFPFIHQSREQESGKAAHSSMVIDKGEMAHEKEIKKRKKNPSLFFLPVQFYS